MTAQDDEGGGKQKAILKAAFTCFSQYGFRRTSMEDIAAAAGMSRPALYLHFRNKTDIFRSLVQVYYDDAIRMVAQALSEPAPPEAVLQNAFRAQSGQIGEALLTSPHGAELLDTGNATSADIVAAGEARLAGLYANWLRQQARSGLIAPLPDTHGTARLFMAALKGIKTPPYADYIASVEQLARLFGRGLRPS
ncbi:helix-turn-helix domain-containing protein [Mesobacterium sp. TK19101]|uniref:Helix-turn-helix domain-containing protein n=1 Tax=Mesobacterium hydrothermale TaxID=3111907 RepID=A0ABU6HHG5_9RHOB|nr:helix-turn-helix domain-containing protein [Mesobacterium sp. TK19101]MEC3861904.1 helix-turn-helix domain-containing protein [Mesobacterium sp. TK19101]